MENERRQRGKYGMEWHRERWRGWSVGGYDKKAFTRKCDAQDMINIQSFSKCNLIFNHFSSFPIFFHNKYFFSGYFSPFSCSGALLFLVPDGISRTVWEIHCQFTCIYVCVCVLSPVYMHDFVCAQRRGVDIGNEWKEQSKAWKNRTKGAADYWICQMSRQHQKHQHPTCWIVCALYIRTHALDRSRSGNNKNTRYLPTPFIWGAINNIEINYRLKLTAINHFIFIISSSFRISRPFVYAYAPPTMEWRNGTIYVRYLRIAYCGVRAHTTTSHSRTMLLKNITALATAISRSLMLSM